MMGLEQSCSYCPVEATMMIQMETDQPTLSLCDRHGKGLFDLVARALTHRERVRCPNCGHEIQSDAIFD